MSKSEVEQKRNQVLNVLLKKRAKLILTNIQQINERIFLDYRIAQAEEILKSAYHIFGENVALAFSGGKDSLVALHLAVHAMGQDLPVLFSSTGVEFPETIQYVQTLAREWNLNLQVAKPATSFFASVRELGWATHEDRWCCRPYKEEPAYQFIADRKIAAEITGTTRTESIYRRSLSPIKIPKKEPFFIRINPIYDWNEWEVWKYIQMKELPYNPLYDRGYRRIGCWCCPINGWTHYRRLKKTHPRLFDFLDSFRPAHPQLEKVAG